MSNNHQEDTSSVTSSEPPPKVKKTADKRSYMREYYHTRQKEDIQCEFCEKNPIMQKQLSSSHA